MFNIFKRKKDSFKLDEETLPNLNNSEQNFNNQNSIPETYPEQDFNNSNLGNPFATQQTNPFETTSTGATFNSGTSSFAPMQSNNENNITNLHNDLTKTKLDNIESKITLIDSRLINLDNKIDMLTKLILTEVSDETKAKLNINDALTKMRNSKQN